MNSTYRQKLFSSKKRYKKANPEKQRSNFKLEILIAPKYKDVLDKILKNK